LPTARVFVPWSNWTIGAQLAFRHQLQLTLPPQRDLALSNPLVYRLGCGADGAGDSALIAEESYNVCRGHAANATFFASIVQLISHRYPTDSRPLRFKLVGVEFSERLLRARTAAQKTQEQVAQSAGISHAAINKAEAGKTKSMGAANLFAIADFLGVDARWLATGEGEMQRDSSSLDSLTPEQKQVVVSVIRSMK
jgi:DNA-binding XRE family transcriptional regulator